MEAAKAGSHMRWVWKAAEDWEILRWRLEEEEAGLSLSPCGEERGKENLCFQTGLTNLYISSNEITFIHAMEASFPPVRRSPFLTIKYMPHHIQAF